MKLQHIGLPLAILLTAGCITEGNFNKKVAGTFCKKFKECEAEQFDAEYSSVGDCRDKNADQFSDSDSDYSECLKEAGCKFSSKQASECKSAISDATCGDLSGGGNWISECAEIYDCTDVSSSEVAGCFISD